MASFGLESSRSFSLTAASRKQAIECPQCAILKSFFPGSTPDGPFCMSCLEKEATSRSSSPKRFQDHPFATNKKMFLQAPESKEVFRAGEQGKKPMSAEQAIECPRCNSADTKFSRSNHSNLSQPKHYCKSCKRCWTRDVTSGSSSPEKVHDPQVILAGITGEEFATGNDHFVRYLAEALDIEAAARVRTDENLDAPPSFGRASVSGGFGGEVAPGSIQNAGTGRGTGVGIETDPRENPKWGIGNVEAVANGENPGIILPPEVDVHTLTLGGLDDALPVATGSYIGDAFSSDSVGGSGLNLTSYYGTGDNPSPKRGHYQQVISAGKNGEEFAGRNDPSVEITGLLCNTGVELNSVRELIKEATPTAETLDIEAAACTGENLAFSDPRQPRVLDAPPSFERASVTGRFGGEVADTGENPNSLSPSNDPPLKLFPPSMKAMGVGLIDNKASYSKSAVTGYSNTNYRELVKRENLGDIAQENHGAGTSQTVVHVAETGTSENTAPLTAANRPPNENHDGEGIERHVNRNPTPPGNDPPEEDRNADRTTTTVSAFEASSSKWAEIFMTVGGGGVTTLYAAIDSKQYPTESKIVAVLLTIVFICGLLSMVLPKRGANRFLVNVGVLFTYSATIGSMAMLLALSRRWVWGITGVCSLLFLLFLVAVAVVKRKPNTAVTTEGVA